MYINQQLLLTQHFVERMPFNSSLRIYWVDVRDVQYYWVFFFPFLFIFIYQHIYALKQAQHGIKHSNSVNFFVLLAAFFHWIDRDMTIIKRQRNHLDVSSVEFENTVYDLTVRFFCESCINNWDFIYSISLIFINLYIFFLFFSFF